MKLKQHPQVEISFNACKFVARGGKIETDIQGFRLEKFRDLRRNKQDLKDKCLQLKGKNGTYAYIRAPDSIIDELILELPNYIDKSLAEIENIEVKDNSGGSIPSR